MARLKPSTACAILHRVKIPIGADFHVLRSSTVSDLLEVANEFGYRKPRNANGSRGRYFHDYLQRLCR